MPDSRSGSPAGRAPEHAPPAPPAPGPVDLRYPVDCMAIADTLGGIKQLLFDPKTQTLDKSVFTGHGARYVGLLPDQTLYFWTEDLDVDDDGYIRKEGVVLINKPSDWAPDDYHLGQTALPGLSAFVDPYIVLPVSGNNWYKDNTQCRLGDGAIVMARTGQFTLAVFGDAGPGDKIGEMSLAAHAKFVGWGELFTTGTAPCKPGSATREERPQTGPMITMVFPGSSGTVNDPYDMAAALKRAKEHFWALSGNTRQPV